MDRLPVEVFVEIFSCMAAAALSSDINNVVDMWTLRGIVAGVSQHWKNVSYSCPALWNVVWIYRFTPPAFLLFNLTQTARRDITVILDLRLRGTVRLRSGVVRVLYATLPAFLDTLDTSLRPQFHRVTWVRFCAATGQEWAPFEARLASYPTPLLRTLHVYCGRPYWTGSAGSGEWMAPLQRVATAGTWVGHNLASYGALSALEIGNVWDPLSLPWASVCDVLSGAYRLSELRISSVDCVDIDPACIVTMAALKTLYLSADSDSCGHVFAQIRAPGLCFLELVVNGDAAIAGIIRSVVSLLHYAEHVRASFLLPLGDGMEVLFTALRNVKFLDLKNVGGVSGYRPHTDYDHSGRVLSHLKRVAEMKPNVMPKVEALKVYERTSEREVRRLLDHLGPQFTTVVGCKDNIAWKREGNEIVREAFEPSEENVKSSVFDEV